MTAKEIERFRRAEALFDGALEHPAGPERDAFLAHETDSELLSEVRQLLANDERVTTSVPPEALPTFGTWQAVRWLGRGGMGVVYLAERADGAFKMKAAVKVVPLALASLDIEERFRRERQFLASLDHPNIARLIDGGLTGSGLPYLVMEFVEGLPIDRYCETRQLDTRARIGLMRQVMEALIYVHGRQVIHRDLKASNILVDAAGAAKLLDFGTAGLVDASGNNTVTRSGIFAFTPECASPEQVQGKPVTFASNIYSSGVLLYRLLTDRPPYQLPDSPGSVEYTVAHAEPEPSGLEGPLDAILRKALRKNAEERYPSAEEMDADLARYLEGQEVLARRPRGLGWIAAAVASLGVCVFAGWLALHRNAAAAAPSIAVLPFTGGGYLSKGVTSEIAENLARRKTLRVVAQSSAEEAAKQADLRKAGRLLNVTNLLTGSVETTGDRVKVVASLIRTADLARVWTNTYQRPNGTLVSIETDLEAAIASSLGIAKSDRPKKHVPGDQAHDLYLKARFELNQATPPTNALAQQHYRSALELDPDYADAWAGLAAAMWNHNLVAAEAPIMAEIWKSLECTQKAIQLDPDLPMGHNNLGMYAMFYDWDWARAEREFEAAAAGQHAGAEYNLSNLYLATGRRVEADEHQRRARDKDPIGNPGMANTAAFLYLEGRFAESNDLVLKLAEQSPGNPLWQARVAAGGIPLGKADEAVRALRRIPHPSWLVKSFLASAESLVGRRDEALGIIRSIEESNHDGRVQNFSFAVMYASVNDERNTLKYLDRAVDLHEVPAIYIHVHPDLAKWQNTPEFHGLKKRMGLDW